MKNPSKVALWAATVLVGATSGASAHHPMGGEMPQTLVQGLLSGLGHPVIGLDHLAFIVAAGVAAGALGLGRLSPLAFVGASIAGVFAHLALLNIPAVELIIAISVLVIGLLMAVSAGRLRAAGWVSLFAFAGLFHGYAYGEAIVGAEPMPLVAYLVGLFAVQAAVALACHALASQRNWLPQTIEPRLVGAAAFGVGLSAVVGQVLG